MAERTPAQEARRRKLELRLLLGLDALLTSQELCEIFAVREAELLSWVKKLPIHMVAGKQHFRYGDVVRLSRVGEETPARSEDAARPAGKLKRATLEPIGRKKTG